ARRGEAETPGAPGGHGGRRVARCEPGAQAGDPAHVPRPHRRRPDGGQEGADRRAADVRVGGPGAAGPVTQKSTPDGSAAEATVPVGGALWNTLRHDSLATTDAAGERLPGGGAGGGQGVHGGQ